MDKKLEIFLVFLIVVIILLFFICVINPSVLMDNILAGTSLLYIVVALIYLILVGKKEYWSGK